MFKRKISVQIFAVLLALTLACSAGNKNEMIIPDLVQPESNDAYLKGELIYPLDNKPTPECHASTIEEIEDGLVAAWFGGTEEKDPDVGIWVSFNFDGKWSKSVEVVNGFQTDDLRYPCWNPVLFQPKEGPLMLFYKVGPSPREWWGMLITSDDGGRSWSEPVKLGEDDKIGHLLGPIKNKPIQLEDGTIICPTSIEIEEGDDDKWMVHFESTKDLGKTWTVVGPINDGVEFDAIQPSVLTYEDGKMQVLCRSRQNVITQSWSEDNGQTWSAMTATELPNPDAGTDAVTLQDGRQLLIYNHTIRKSEFPRSRNMLNLAISEDGKNWKPVMTLERQEGEYSYPAIIQSKDGLVHITYTFRRKSVKYVVVDPAKM
jgi:predicted neuraminidase